MTDISKEAVDALLKGVTDGPWVVEAETLFGKEDGYTVGLFDLIPYETNECHEADARFIAAARELVPALRAALDEAEAERDAANALLQRLTEWDECWPSKDVQNITHEARAHLGAKP